MSSKPVVSWQTMMIKIIFQPDNLDPNTSIWDNILNFWMNLVCIKVARGSDWAQGIKGKIHNGSKWERDRRRWTEGQIKGG